MFTKFSRKENVSGISQVKSSVQRGIRQAIVDQMPLLKENNEELAEELLPKKTPMSVAKCQNHITIIVVNGQPLFFQIRDGPYLPTLKLLHKYPALLPHMQVDRGAVKFVMRGADIKCPGLTSPGGRMDLVSKDVVVAIMVEGKQHALGVGITKLSTNEIKNVNSGDAIENIHYLNDGLYNTDRIE